MGIVKHI